MRYRNRCFGQIFRTFFVKMSNEPLSLMYSTFGVHQSAISNVRQSVLPSMTSDYSQRLSAMFKSHVGATILPTASAPHQMASNQVKFVSNSTRWVTCDHASPVVLSTFTCRHGLTSIAPFTFHHLYLCDPSGVFELPPAIIIG